MKAYIRLIVLVIFVLVITSAMCPIEAAETFKPKVLLAGFESDFDLKLLNCANCKVEISKDMHTQGSLSLKIDFDAIGKQALAFLKPSNGESFDLSKFKLISLDVQSQRGTVMFGFSLYQDQEHQFWGYFPVTSGTSKTISLDLESAAVKGIDLSKIKRIDFYVPADFGETVVFADNLRLIPYGDVSSSATYFETFASANIQLASKAVWKPFIVTGKSDYKATPNTSADAGNFLSISNKQKNDDGAWRGIINTSKPSFEHTFTLIYHTKPGDKTFKPYAKVTFVGVEYSKISQKYISLPIKSKSGQTGSIQYETSLTMPGNATDVDIQLGAKGKGTVQYDMLWMQAQTKTAQRTVNENQTPWQASWIWASEAYEQRDWLYARDSFDINGDVESAYLQLTADNSVVKIGVNSNIVKPGKYANDWPAVDLHDITRYVRQGKNVVTVLASNAGGPGGLVYEVSVNMKDGTTKIIASGSQTKTARIAPDDWILTGFDDSGWKPAAVLAQPPAGVWGKLEHKYAGARRTLEVVKINAPISAGAGESVKVSANIMVPKDAALTEPLSISLYNGSNSYASAVLPQQKRLSADKPNVFGPAIIKIPTFLKKGEYRLVVENSNLNINNPPTAITINKEIPTPLQPTVVIKEYQGAPTVFINGKPIYYMSFTTLGTYHYGNNPITFYKGKHIKQVSQAGIHVFSFSSIFKWLGPDQYDFSENDKTIAQVMESDPNAYIMIKLSTLLNGSWWFDQNPDELIMDSDGKKPFVGGVSYASKKYREEFAKAVRAHVEHIKNSPYANRVIGYMVAGFSVEEWLHHGEMDPTSFVDYNPQVAAMFRQWLTKEYGSDVNALKKAWNNNAVTFETAAIPSKAERARADFYSLRDPQKSQNVIDFTRFWGHLSADTVLWCAKTFKEATDNKLMIGVHYGYIPELSSTVPRLQNAGHLGFYEVLQSPLIDFYVSPQSYSDREIGQTSSAMIPAASVTMHGKLHYIESDPRTFMSAPDSSYGRTDTLRDSIEVLRREFAINLCTESNVSWLDLGIDWYDNKGLLDTIGQLQRIGTASLGFDRQNAAEVAVVLDERSAAYYTLDSMIPRSSIYDIRYRLNRMGLPWECYVMSDIKNIPWDKYKMVVFLNAYAPDNSTRQYIKEKVSNNNRTIVWMYAPGYINNGQFSTDAMQDLTGIKMGVKDTQQVITVKTISSLKGLQAGSEFGSGLSAGPVFYADDPDANIIGQINLDSLPGFVIKKMKNYTSVYIASTDISPDAFRAIAQHAGAHVYNSINEALYANNKFLAVHTSTAGQRKFNLKTKTSVYDIFADKLVGKDVVSFKANLRANVTRIYFLGSEGEIAEFRKGVGK